MFIMFCHLLIFFFKIRVFQKESFRNITRVSNIFYPDQVRCFVEPDLSQKCFAKKLSADVTSRVRVYEDGELIR